MRPITLGRYVVEISANGLRFVGLVLDGTLLEQGVCTLVKSPIVVGLSFYLALAATAVAVVLQWDWLWFLAAVNAALFFLGIYVSTPEWWSAGISIGRMSND